ncbi:DUF3953 domain-containing protein [Clostridium sp. C2-6-12]|uniref:DUF3953 domain-containing protein n=1 Tax=Clostridium sp. C2-6-12 TaxID=2698832 RepID=UPI001371324C|nr:DUF3953 domain-containing protein [Clostridium sp. C2-6-12]
MKINNNIFYMASLVFSILTAISMFLISMDVAGVFLGLTQLLFGLDRYKFGEKIDLEENQKGNKYVGILSIGVGIFCIIISISRLIS